MLSEQFVKAYYFYLKSKAQEILKDDSCLNIDSKNKYKTFFVMDFEDLKIHLKRMQNLFEKAGEV